MKEKQKCVSWSKKSVKNDFFSISEFDIRFFFSFWDRNYQWARKLRENIDRPSLWRISFSSTRFSVSIFLFVRVEKRDKQKIDRFSFSSSIKFRADRKSNVSLGMATQKNNDRRNQQKKTNFLRQFRDEKSKELKQLTAAQFIEIWSHYDTDGNGFIEGHELDDLLRELASSVNANDAGPEVKIFFLFQRIRFTFLSFENRSVDSRQRPERTESFVSRSLRRKWWRSNRDRRSSSRKRQSKRIFLSFACFCFQLAEILPTEENFLLLFRKDNPLESSVDFMKVWKEFDTDSSGFIEAEELKQFIKALLTKRRGKPITEEKLIEYTETIVKTKRDNFAESIFSFSKILVENFRHERRRKTSVQRNDEVKIRRNSHRISKLKTRKSSLLSDYSPSKKTFSFGRSSKFFRRKKSKLRFHFASIFFLGLFVVDVARFRWSFSALWQGRRETTLIDSSWISFFVAFSGRKRYHRRRRTRRICQRFDGSR